MLGVLMNLLNSIDFKSIGQEAATTVIEIGTIVALTLPKSPTALKWVLAVGIMLYIAIPILLGFFYRGRKGRGTPLPGESAPFFVRTLCYSDHPRLP